MRVLQVMELPIILLSLYLFDVRHLFPDIMMVKERLVKKLQNKISPAVIKVSVHP